MIGGDENGARSAGQTLRHQTRIIAFHNPLVAQTRRVVKRSEFRFRALLPIGMGEVMKLI